MELAAVTVQGVPPTVTEPELEVAVRSVPVIVIENPPLVGPPAGLTVVMEGTLKY